MTSSDYYQGYTGLFRVPYDSVSNHSSTIYCISNYVKTMLIIIPLTPGFFSDAFRIAKTPQYQEIYILPPSLDCIYISDVFNLYQELKALDKVVVKVICSIPPDGKVSDGFMRDFELRGTTEFHFDPYGINAMDLYVKFDRHLNPEYRPSNDIIISDSNKTMILSQYMSNDKLDYLAGVGYDEIHMSFAHNTYGGLTYLQAVNYNKKLADKIIVNSFVSVDEFNYCASNSIPTGKIRYNEFAGTTTIR